MKRFTVSVPDELFDQITYICRRYGISRGAFVDVLLSGKLNSLYDTLLRVPEGTAPPPVVRNRGNSRDVIESRAENMRRLTDDLFSD